MSYENNNKVVETKYPEKPERRDSPIKYFISGGFGGICTVLIGHPLDTIKVRFQTMPVPGPNEKPLYTGLADCMLKILKMEGIRGFYKGMGTPLIGVAPIFAISFYGYGLGKELLKKTNDEQLTAPKYFCAGAFSGIFTTTITAPGERIKCLLQVQLNNTNRKYRGPVDCARQLYKEGGIRNIYKGTCATLLRDIPASGVYFMVYDCLKDMWTPEGGKIGFDKTLLAGGFAGIAHWIVGMPPDVLKSRLQTAPEGTYKRGIRDVFKVLMKNEGPKALYRGFLPVMIRAFQANATCFFGFECTLTFLNFVLPDL